MIEEKMREQSREEYWPEMVFFLMWRDGALE
jgi:hypothetical protein